MKYEPHAFTLKIFNWRYCSKCGLMALRNKPSQKAVKLGCNWEEHVYFKKAARHG